ncbi:MAG TPA: hypothetical protein VJM79_10085 [Rhizorhapis sp.]|nr:hypothetical protein [Rhizorhapis sp.]
MAKQKKPSAEERLIKLTEPSRLMEAQMQLLMPAQIWAYVEQLVRDYLIMHANDKVSRDLVSQMALACRMETMARFGHDSLETFALAKMLRTDGPRFRQPAPRPDAITHINNYPHKPHRLEMDQENAANDIIRVWTAFGKFLEVSSRSIGGGGSARSQALGPVDVMGQDLWDHHRQTYTPWYQIASKIPVARRTAGLSLTVAGVVFKILIEDLYPEQLDSQFALIKGTALRALKAGLTAYADPALLANWGKPKIPPAGAPLGGKPGPGGPTPQPDPVSAASGEISVPKKRPPGLWQPPKPKLPPDGKVKLAPRRAKGSGSTIVN